MLDAWVRFRDVPDDPPIHAGLLAQFTGHMPIAAALRAARRHRPGPGPRHPVHRHQRDLALAPRRRPGRPVDAVPPPLDLRRRRHDARRVPRATTRRAPSWPRSPSTPWSAASPTRPRPTPGAGCEPHHRARAARHRPGRLVLEDRSRPAWSSSSPTRAASRASSDGRAVIDTERALLVHRAGQTLTYAFPADEVGDLPAEPEPEAPGYVRVPWDAVDAWYEEGRKLVHYPPNPYHRVDCRPTKRRLRVEVAGTTLVDTDDTIILFETSLAPKLYVAPALVRTDLLRRSDDHDLLQLQGRGDVLVRGHRRHRRRGRRLDLRGPAPREPPDQGLVQLRAHEGRRRRRAPRAPRRPRRLRLLPVKPEQERSVPKSRKGEQTRARLIVAAKTVFERDGFLDARIVDIAERAELSPGPSTTTSIPRSRSSARSPRRRKQRLTAPPDGTRPPPTCGPRAHPAGEPPLPRALPRRSPHHGGDRAGLALRRPRQRGADGPRSTSSNGPSAASGGCRRRASRPHSTPRMAADALGAMVARFAELWLVQDYPEYDFDEAVDQLTLLWGNAPRAGGRAEDGPQGSTLRVAASMRHYDVPKERLS